jgi:hypothetical protein
MIAIRMGLFREPDENQRARLSLRFFILRDLA